MQQRRICEYARPWALVLQIGTTMNHLRRGLAKIEDTVLLAEGLRSGDGIRGWLRIAG